MNFHDEKETMKNRDHFIYIFNQYKTNIRTKFFSTWKLLNRSSLILRKMKNLKLIMIIICALFSFVIAWTEEILKEFKEWETEMELDFPCKADKNSAIANYIKNREKILQHNMHKLNLKNCTYDLGLWEFSYMNDSEVNSRLNGLKIPDDGSQEETPVQSRTAYIAGFEINPPPENVTSLNWADQGFVVRGVRKQGKLFMNKKASISIIWQCR